MGGRRRTRNVATDDAAVKADPPVYDERGNVRPRGTKGARTMTYAERVEIAERLAKGEQIVTEAEKENADD